MHHSSQTYTSYGNNKKKIFTAFLLCFAASLIIAMTLTGCSPVNNPANDGNKLSIVTTIFAPYDFAREITVDKADITMLIPPASESHSYEPTPQDIIKIQNSDIFIYVGGISDTWADKILSSMNTSNIRIIALIDCVDTLTEEFVEGMEGHEHDHGNNEKAKYDEHVWTSPKNAKLIVQKISTAICQADTKNADHYQKNTDVYLSKLEELDAAFQDAADNAKRKTLVFGDRFPFRYLASAYGFEYFAAFPGCASETEASARTVAFLIDKVRTENIPVVFHIELSNMKMANTISESTGAKVMLLHSCHNITRDDFQNGLSYLELMHRNINALKEALQ